MEEITYRDTWGRGADSFISMLYERLKLLHGLLADNGSIYVHCDYRMNSQIRLILDEIFATTNFRNEITWQRIQGAKGNSKNQFGNNTDTILFYAKTSKTFFNPSYTPLSDEYVEKFYRHKDEDGRIYRKAGGNRPAHYKYYLDESKGTPVGNLWVDIGNVQGSSRENTGYPTQKPVKLLERVIQTSSEAGDIVLDCFVGSGTTLEAAEKLGRKWIGCDISRFAIHTSRKRMLNIQRQLKKEAKPYRAFEILNLGRYERQHYLGLDSNVSNKQLSPRIKKKIKEFQALIAGAYGAELVSGFKTLHAKRGSRMVVIGSLDTPVSKILIGSAIKEAFNNNITQLDILGFDFEMGVEDNMRTIARDKGIDLSWRMIPREVFDKRAVEKGQVIFHNLGYVEVKPIIEGRNLAIELTDFSVYYSPDDLEDLSSQLKPGNSKIVISDGQIIKSSKDPKTGDVNNEPLTKKWSDWIDYWGIDFDFESRKEIVRFPQEPIKDTNSKSYREVWMGDYIFENEWQSFRTKSNRNLELRSMPHQYTKSGSYKVAIKVIDIFGNDTTKVIKVDV